jgi:hypothetical protein
MGRGSGTLPQQQLTPESGVPKPNVYTTLSSTGGMGVFGHTIPVAQPATIKPEEITVKVAMERIDKVLKEYGLTA